MARSVRDFRGDSSVSSWLYTIARRFCIKKRRRSKFTPAREESLNRTLAICRQLPTPDVPTSLAASVKAAIHAFLNHR
jgi:DNA-directed RNA polymerase specialized sigma24 family protein